jgi:outer membrane receptor protein involved in Fe transport
MNTTTEMDPILRHAVRRALLGAGALVASTIQSPLAQAQQAPPKVADITPELQEVVVTGSRIAAPNLDAISPVTAITAEEIKTTGVTRIEDLVNSLPQVVGDQGSGISMGSNGTATLNLRGLGSQRTLVLINGRRLQGGDPGGNFGANPQFASAADINQIPVALVERVDVLTGGASSTYGADAVAGVVNFIMNDHFEGIRVDANAGIYNHSNHQGFIDPLLTARKFPPVTGTNWDGQNKDLTIIMGHNFADGAGNMEAYLGYRRASPITADHRDHAACVLDNGYDLSSGTSFAPYKCFGSSNSAPAIFFGANSTVNQIGPTGDVTGRYQRFNYAASHYLQRNDERYTAGFFGKLKFSDHVEAYTEFTFMDDRTSGFYAPAGAFLGSLSPATDANTGLPDGNLAVNCGAGNFGNSAMNPYLTASEFSVICAGGAAGGPVLAGPVLSYKNGANPGAVPYQIVGGDAQLTLGRRNVEGGPRQDNYTHTAYRGVIGARGEIVQDWTYDAYGLFSQTRASDFHNNDTSTNKIQAALFAVKDPVTGAIVCRPPAANGCVPWNIWNPTIPITAAQLAWISSPGLFQASTEEDIVSAYVNGDLTRRGLKLPTADDGLKVVFGAEYRRDRLSTNPDAEFQTADLAGFGSPVPPVAANVHVWEAFTEERMPLMRNMPFAKTLDLEAGYRYSSYSVGFNTNTYKFGVEWAPVSDVRLRASYNRAVRVPNIQELFQPQHVGLDAGGDGCATKQYTAAQCALAGLSPAVYGSATLVSPAGQYNGFIGGNPNMKPEVGTTTNVGLVFTPSFLPHFSATLDYTDIKITGLVQSYGPNLILKNCIASGDPASSWCSLIHRNVSGSLWSSPQGYTIDPLLNEGGLENKSVDLGVAYRFDLGSFGRLRTRLDSGYLLKLLATPGASTPYDCAGKFGPSCSPATPKYRHRFSTDWDTPVSGLAFGATWRYFGGSKNTLLDPGMPDYVGPATIAANGPPPDAHIASISYLDLRVAYTLDKVTARLGVNNVLDKDPPIIDTVNSGGNQIFAESNTFPGMYDNGGRYLFLNLTVDF